MAGDNESSDGDPGSAGGSGDGGGATGAHHAFGAGHTRPGAHHIAAGHAAATGSHHHAFAAGHTAGHAATARGDGAGADGFDLAEDGLDGVEPEVIGLKAIQLIVDIWPATALPEQVGDGVNLIFSLVGFAVIGFDLIGEALDALALLLDAVEGAGVEFSAVEGREPGHEEDDEEAGEGGEDEGFFASEGLLSADGIGDESDLDGTGEAVAQSEADDLAEHMGDFLQALAVDGGPESDDLEGVEVDDLEVQFFGKEMIAVGHG